MSEKDGEWARDSYYEENMKNAVFKLMPIINQLVYAEEQKSKLDA